MFGHSLKRLTREGVKSLSVPIIALVFVILINLLGGIKSWLETQYENTLENFPVIAVLSNLSGDNTDELEIDMRYINLFSDPDANFSLYDFTGDIAMRRIADNAGVSGQTDDFSLIGISGIRSDAALNPETGAEITFFPGYDEQVFTSNELVCVISEDMNVFVNNGLLNVILHMQLPDDILWHEGVMMYGNMSNWIYAIEVDGVIVEVDIDDYTTIIPGEIVTQETELMVVGTVTGVDRGTIFSPFWTVNELAEELTEVPPFSDSLSITVSDNRELDAFKETASLSFPRTNPVFDSRPFAMTIMDLEFYETLEPLRQNIIVVDVATPFIYILSVAVGFLTSVLLTRRRKAEFAVMRSIGVNKWVVFANALTEQVMLSIAGAVLGVAFVTIAWGYTSYTRPGVFLACYLFGSVFASIGAARTNVMKVLRDRRE